MISAAINPSGTPAKAYQQDIENIKWFLLSASGLFMRHILFFPFLDESVIGYMDH